MHMMHTQVNATYVSLIFTTLSNTLTVNVVMVTPCLWYVFGMIVNDVLMSSFA